MVLTLLIPSNVPAGTYQVTLKFAETYSGDFVVGDRVFDVYINGTEVLTNFDIYAKAGGNTAIDQVFNNIVLTSGLITLQFKGTTQHGPQRGGGGHSNCFPNRLPRLLPLPRLPPLRLLCLTPQAPRPPVRIPIHRPLRGLRH